MGQLGTWLFVLWYLLYPSNSKRIFATFGCQTLDDPDETRFLLADMQVDCKTPFHGAVQIWAGVMIFVYPLGLPVLYAYLLFVRCAQRPSARSVCPARTIGPHHPRCRHPRALHGRYGREMRLLRSLELKRVSLLKDVHAAQELAAAHAHVKQSRSSLWSADLLNQTSGGALPSTSKHNS